MGSPRTPSPLRIWRSHDGWDVSHSSASSGSSSSVGKSSSWTSLESPSRRNPVKFAAKAITSCFGSAKSDPTTSLALEEPTYLGTPTATPARSTNGRSEGGRRIIGLYSNRSPPAMQPGGVKYTMAEIQKATRNFSPSLKIGQGGSGAVYKAQLADGTFVAVKRGRKNVHDRHLNTVFHNEIQTLSRIEHLNLVRLHGFVENDYERIIVVEYVPNGTLREHLDCERGKPLDLAARLDIAIDVAHAVTYLHMYSDQPIIHRDIKSSNILLTDNLRAKVADFGLARVGVTESDMSHVLTQVKGTAGYLDPEYLSTCQLTEKSDVYSFGVLLVELITGRSPIQPKRDLNERTTFKWAMKKFSQGDGIQTLDPNIEQDRGTALVVEEIFELAFQCLAHSRRRRPNMESCGKVLWNIRKKYREKVSKIQGVNLEHTRLDNT